MQVNETIALKEWAVIIEALQEGTQAIILRKGGIREETKKFQVQSSEFFLYPTFEHQKEAAIKPEHRGILSQTLENWSPTDTIVRITSFAKVEVDLEISEQEALEKLRAYHIGTDEFAAERLNWKRNNPLHVLVLRVYKLDQPIELPIEPSYIGCKSWIQLQPQQQSSLSDIAMHPVLDESTFNALVQNIKSSIE